MKRCTSSVSNRKNDHLPLPYAVFFCKPAIHFNDILRPSSGRVKRAGISYAGYSMLNIDDGPFTIRKNNVQRDQGILHPERQFLLALENKQHPIILPQAIPKHQSRLPFRIRVRNLRKNSHISRFRDKGKSRGFFPGDKKYACNKNNKQGKKKYFFHRKLKLPQVRYVAANVPHRHFLWFQSHIRKGEYPLSFGGEKNPLVRIFGNLSIACGHKNLKLE